VKTLHDLLSEYVIRCLSENTPPHVNELACQLGLTASQLSKTFQRAHGIRPSGVIKAMQMAHARNLLHRTRRPVWEIAIASGFTSAEAFSRAFRCHHGMTPLQWRKNKSISERPR
jgi:AraC-like DNA-binding protein